MATETLASVPEMLQADVAALQADVAALQTDMAVIKGQLPHLATKADMERGFRQMTWALVSALLVGLTALAGLIVALQIFG